MFQLIVQVKTNHGMISLIKLSLHNANVMCSMKIQKSFVENPKYQELRSQSCSSINGTKFGSCGLVTITISRGKGMQPRGTHTTAKT